MSSEENQQTVGEEIEDDEEETEDEEEDEQEEGGGLNAAYSMSDLLGELDDTHVPGEVRENEGQTEQTAAYEDNGQAETAGGHGQADQSAASDVKGQVETAGGHGQAEQTAASDVKGQAETAGGHGQAEQTAASDVKGQAETAGGHGQAEQTAASDVKGQAETAGGHGQAEQTAASEDRGAVKTNTLNKDNVEAETNATAGHKGLSETNAAAKDKGQAEWIATGDAPKQSDVKDKGQISEQRTAVEDKEGHVEQDVFDEAQQAASDTSVIANDDSSPNPEAVNRDSQGTLQKIASDISGRFHVHGAQYVDQKEGGPTQEYEDSASTPQFDPLYDDVAKKGGTLGYETGEDGVQPGVVDMVALFNAGLMPLYSATADDGHAMAGSPHLHSPDIPAHFLVDPFNMTASTSCFLSDACFETNPNNPFVTLTNPFLSHSPGNPFLESYQQPEESSSQHVELGFSENFTLSMVGGQQAATDTNNGNQSGFTKDDGNSALQTAFKWNQDDPFAVVEATQAVTEESASKNVTFGPNVVVNPVHADLWGEIPLDSNEEVYENVSYGTAATSSNHTPGPDGDGEDEEDDDDDYDGWSSSEFESYDDSEHADGEGRRRGGRPAGHDHTLPPPPLRRKDLSRDGKGSRSSISPDIQIPEMLNRLAARLQSPKSKKEEDEEQEEEEEVIELVLNLDKHPPPELPPQPEGLTTLQLKRRHIVASIVESEQSYTSSLRCIIEDYEKPLLEVSPRIISRVSIRTIFYKVRQILQCHHMFRIELAEYVKVWDEYDKIGNVFTASFSKGMVFDAYSAFVNNFSVAMEAVKKQARSKPLFAEFLKLRQESAADRLSLFGLMVKPVQRFPQFIMLLQDLLKQTERDHHDRLALQMALTELENLTHRLNETKRESENRHDVQKIMRNLTGRHQLKSEGDRYLVRRDDMRLVSQQNGEIKSKPRRLFLMNDQLVCASVAIKENETTVLEKYKYKWSVPVTEVEVVQVPVKSDYTVKSAYGKTTITSLKTDKMTEVEVHPNNPFKKEIDDMLHDLPVVEQIGQLVAQLRMKYQGLNSAFVHAMTRSLQVGIQQKAEVDHCILQLAVPAKYNLSNADRLKEVSRQIRNSTISMVPSRGLGKTVYAFQLSNPGIKHDWLLELQNTKLALEPKNNPGWCIPENDALIGSKQPLFMCPLLMDITKPEAKKLGFLKSKKKKKNLIECAVSVILPSPDFVGIGMQHLWVCSNNGDKGHVSIVSMHTNQPHVVESFKTADSAIISAEMVPGFASCEHSHAFSMDTVWMSMEDKKIQVRSVVEADRKAPLMTFTLDSMAWTLQYMDNRVFAGLHSGHLVIISRNHEGVWQLKQRESLHLGVDPIRCMLPINHDLWVACGHCLHTVSILTHYSPSGSKLKIQQKQHEVGALTDGQIESLVKAGVGLVLSFRNKSTLRLLHLETLDTIAEMNTSAVVAELWEGKDAGNETKDALKNIHITCLLASKGLLWIGTNVGCILTLPLPRLEGVPQIKGRPTISYHAHTGPVKFLVPIQCGMVQLQADATIANPEFEEAGQEPGTNPVSEEEVNDLIFIEGVTNTESEDARGFSMSDDTSRQGTLSGSMNKWLSSPDLRGNSLQREDDVHMLYGSLLRGLDEDMECMDSPRRKRKSRSGLSIVTNNAQMLQNKISQTVAKFSSSSGLTTPTTPKSKYATLPIVAEECPVYENINMNREDMIELPSDASNSGPPSVGNNSPQQQRSDLNRSASAGSSADETPGSYQRVISIDTQWPQAAHNPYSKALIIVSGAEGHVHLTGPRQDSSLEDICLLLWQCWQ